MLATQYTGISAVVKGKQLWQSLTRTVIIGINTELDANLTVILSMQAWLFTDSLKLHLCRHATQKIRSGGGEDMFIVLLKVQ